MVKKKILVTGASGFIGGALFHELQQSKESVFALCRRPGLFSNARLASLQQAELLPDACVDIDTVYHCAGFAHAWSKVESNYADHHQSINFEGTRNLIDAAGRSGVRRFVFLSSVKAMGEPGEACADEDWPLPPMTPYGQAKRAAEDAVLEVGARYGMHVVNLRLAMVYGPGGRGNLERMAALVRRGWFPPLPETGNRRSLVYVDDVVSAMRLVAHAPAAAGRTWIVADEAAYSGRELYVALRAALGLAPCRHAVPAGGLAMVAAIGDRLERLLGRRLPFDSEVLDKLLGSAWYSSARLRGELGWRPQVSLAEGLQRMCRA